MIAYDTMQVIFPRYIYTLPPQITKKLTYPVKLHQLGQLVGQHRLLTGLIPKFQQEGCTLGMNLWRKESALVLINITKFCIEMPSFGVFMRKPRVLPLTATSTKLIMCANKCSKNCPKTKLQG
jgi:hypothetical protein